MTCGEAQGTAAAGERAHDQLHPGVAACVGRPMRCGATVAIASAHRLTGTPVDAEYIHQPSAATIRSSQQLAAGAGYCSSGSASIMQLSGLHPQLNLTRPPLAVLSCIADPGILQLPRVASAAASGGRALAAAAHLQGGDRRQPERQRGWPAECACYASHACTQIMPGVVRHF